MSASNPSPPSLPRDPLRGRSLRGRSAPARRGSSAPRRTTPVRMRGPAPATGAALFAPAGAQRCACVRACVLAGSGARGVAWQDAAGQGDETAGIACDPSMSNTRRARRCWPRRSRGRRGCPSSTPPAPSSRRCEWTPAQRERERFVSRVGDREGGRDREREKRERERASERESIHIEFDYRPIRLSATQFDQKI